jgi:TRAP-type uncharacterized transport system fused permease subunit
LLASVICNISAANGIEIPLLAVHPVCLHFGGLADATSALATFAASGISGEDPFKTGVYELRFCLSSF